jgi:hypothetical protein
MLGKTLLASLVIGTPPMKYALGAMKIFQPNSLDVASSHG